MEVSGPQNWSDHFGEEKILSPLPGRVDNKNSAANGIQGYMGIGMKWTNTTLKLKYNTLKFVYKNDTLRMYVCLCPLRTMFN